MSMDNENVWFRQQAGLLVDELKKPENADLLDMFVNFDAKKDGGFRVFLHPTPETPRELVRHLTKRHHVKFYLTPEQSERWREMEKPFDYPGNSGHAVHVVMLVAQLMLGRLDVVDADSDWFK